MSIVLSSTVVFFLVWIVVRIVGKRELSELSPFDIVVLVVLGDLITEAVLAEDTSITGALTAVATFALLTLLLSWVSWRLPKYRNVFEGVPTLLVRDGRVLDDALTAERLNHEDLLTAAREEGIESLDRVKWAVLEQDGQFSFYAEEG